MDLPPTEDFIMIAENADGRALLEFVADALLVRPLRPKLVNEDDGVALSNRELGRVWGEGNAFHDVRLLALVSRFRRESVAALAILIEELYNLVHANHREALRIRRPRDSGDLSAGRSC